MIGLLQRVSEAKVIVDDKLIGQIQTGLLVFVGIEKQDSEQQADRLLEKLLNYRVFSDANGKMNLSVKDVAGGLLLVSQFTLVANTEKGLRPSFSSAAEPKHSQELYNYLINQAKQKYNIVESGQFAADMKVHLCNDGPVTFFLRVPPEE